MSSTFHRSPLHLAAGALALASALAVATPVHAAAYATGGDGQYRDEILWLTWGGGVNGTHEQALANGSSTTASIPVTATQSLDVSCTLGGISGGSAPGAGLASYRSGNYTGDPLDDLYNIGGTGNGNQLVAGINTTTGTETKRFTVDCTATLGGQPYRIPGLVMADAESLEAGGTPAAPAEYLEGTASGTWNVVEMLRVPARTYYATKTAAGSQQTLRFGPGGQASGTSPGAMTFLTFNPDAYQGGSEAIEMAFTVKGGGRTAIAIGLLVPKADFGDAPGSYGDAAHLLASLVPVADGLTADGEPVDINSVSFQLGELAPPATGFLGGTGADGESASQPGAAATGDDTTGSAGASEEDAWPTTPAISTAQAGSVLARSIACQGAGTVAGWIDFDRDGAFGAGERSAAVCAGGSAALQWTLPATLQAGPTYVRLRYASVATQVTAPVGEADDGEVEDHRIEIVAPSADLRIEKSNPTAELESGTTTQYTLRVVNDGPAAADGAIVSDDWTTVAGLDCNAGPLACTTAGTAGTTCPAAVTPAQLQAGVAIPVLPVDGEILLALTCRVTASGID